MGTAEWKGVGGGEGVGRGRGWEVKSIVLLPLKSENNLVAYFMKFFIQN